MSRFKCKSQLIISCVGLDLRTIKVRLNHHDNHIAYYDVALPPGASQIIRENLEWSTPVSVTPRVQAIYPHITGKQIHTAWTQMSEKMWRSDKKLLPSAENLLREVCDEVDVFEIEVEEGVQQLCWGMKKVGKRLRGKVVEIGIDATCKLS